MRSTPTASCWGWARPTWAPACPAPWPSAGACPRPPSTAPPAARTQLSGLVVAALTILALLTLTGLFQGLPQAKLAAAGIAAVIGLVAPPALAAPHPVYTR